MFVRLNPVPAEQTIEALPFDSGMAGSFAHLPAVTLEDFFQISSGNFTPTLFLRLGPGERRQGRIGDLRSRELDYLGREISHIDSVVGANDASSFDRSA